MKNEVNGWKFTRLDIRLILNLRPGLREGSVLECAKYSLRARCGYCESHSNFSQQPREAVALLTHQALGHCMAKEH